MCKFGTGLFFYCYRARFYFPLQTYIIKTITYAFVFSSDAPPTPNPKGQCPYGFKDLVPSSEYCYRIKADSVDADGKSWGDANTQCIAHGASLASIHSDDVQDAIYLDIQAKPLDVWIGLQANSKRIMHYYV